MKHSAEILTFPLASWAALEPPHSKEHQQRDGRCRVEALPWEELRAGAILKSLKDRHQLLLEVANIPELGGDTTGVICSPEFEVKMTFQIRET